MNHQLKELQSARNKAIYDLGIIDIQKTDLENQRNNIINFLQKLANDEQELRKGTLETIPESSCESPHESPQKTRQEKSTVEDKKLKISKQKKKSKEQTNFEISGVQIKN